jgi:type I restriction enzyme M protein
MEADGYSLDDKRTFIDGKGDIPDIIERFKKRREERPTDRKAKCFYVLLDEIKKKDYDLSISRYKEIEYEEIKYDPPEVMIQRIEKIESQILRELGELKSLLEDAQRRD